MKRNADYENLKKAVLKAVNIINSMSLKERDKVIKCPIVKNNIKYLDRLTDKES